MDLTFKSLGEEGVEWLTDFFNVILKTAMMAPEWRYSTIIPPYKNKGMLKTVTTIGALNYSVPQ